MIGLKKKRRILMIVIGMLLLAASSALIGYALKDGIEFFRSPTQVVENRPGPNERFRIGGLVEVDSLIRGEGKTITFVVTIIVTFVTIMCFNAILVITFVFVTNIIMTNINTIYDL